MQESDAVALMRLAVKLYQAGQEAVQLSQMEPSVAFSSAYGLLRRSICDHISEIEMRFSDDPAKQGWRQIVGGEVPEIIFSVQGQAEKFELPCPVTQLEEWSLLRLVRERLMGYYRDDAFKQLRAFRDQGKTEALRVTAGEMCILLKHSCAQFVPVKYSLPEPPHNVYRVSPDMSMLPADHWSKNVFNILFAGFSSEDLSCLSLSLGGDGPLKGWVVALRPFK